ncbi:MAG: hypothetical protein M1839_004490 [Geoglossum umbratile]|nr:MAG: hypothetical protein M1839_004490 [Geoglossum umbratile]
MSFLVSPRATPWASPRPVETLVRHEDTTTPDAGEGASSATRLAPDTGVCLDDELASAQLLAELSSVAHSEVSHGNINNLKPKRAKPDPDCEAKACLHLEQDGKRFSACKGLTFENAWNQKDHNFLHVKPWECKKCFRQFNKHSNCERHEQQDKCKLPSKQGRTVDERYRASRIVSAQGWDQNKLAVSLPPGTGVDVTVRTWHCQTCGGVFDRKGLYDNHAQDKSHPVICGGAEREILGHTDATGTHSLPGIKTDSLTDSSSHGGSILSRVRSITAQFNTVRESIRLLDDSQKKDTVHSLNGVRGESAGQADLINLILRDVGYESAGDSSIMAHVPGEATTNLPTKPPVWSAVSQPSTTNEEPISVASNSDSTGNLSQMADQFFGISNLYPFFGMETPGANQSPCHQTISRPTPDSQCDMEAFFTAHFGDSGTTENPNDTFPAELSLQTADPRAFTLSTEPLGNVNTGDFTVTEAAAWTSEFRSLELLPNSNLRETNPPVPPTSRNRYDTNLSLQLPNAKDPKRVSHSSSIDPTALHTPTHKTAPLAEAYGRPSSVRGKEVDQGKKYLGT